MQDVRSRQGDHVGGRLNNPGGDGAALDPGRGRGERKDGTFEDCWIPPHVCWGISLLVDTNYSELLVASNGNHMWLIQADECWNQAWR